LLPSDLSAWALETREPSYADEGDPVTSAIHRPVEPVTFLVFDISSGGGVARAVANVANQLARTRPVRVISLYRRRRNPRYPLDPSIEVMVLRRARNQPQKRTGLDRLPSRLKPTPSEQNMSRLTDVLLRRALQEVRWGVVVSTRPSLHLALASFARPEVTTVGWDHLNFPGRSSDPQQMRVLHAAVPRLDGFVVLTEADADDYRRAMPGLDTEVTVIRNAVSWPVAAQPPALEAKVIVAAGRLAARKGQGRLIRAFAPVAAAHPDWQLHVYGAGERRKPLRALIRTLGLQSQVKLCGFTHDLPEVLRNGSVYAMASRWEGFPLVLIEAMSVGLPLIAFDCPRGPGETIRHRQNGLLVEDGRLPEYTRGLLELVQNVELRRRLGRQGLLDAEQYTIENIARDWERLFARLAAPTAGASTSDERRVTTTWYPTGRRG